MISHRLVPHFSLAVVLLLLGIGRAIPQQAAAPSIYNVEVIVFRTLGALGTAEDWGAEGHDPTVGAEDDTPAPASAESTSSGRLVGSIPAADFKLGEIEAKLRASGGYSPIAHAAWQQTASPWGSRVGFPLDKLGLAASGLSGTIALERGQYLHLGVELNYSPATLTTSAGYVLVESRRVKFFERNYFDHPAFGVIALVTPAQGARRAGR